MAIPTTSDKFSTPPRPARKPYVPAITPGLRKLFYVVLALLALWARTRPTC